MAGGGCDLVENDDNGLAGEFDREAATIKPDELPGQVIARSGRQLSRGWGQLTRRSDSKFFCWFGLSSGRNGSGHTQDSRQQRSGSPSHGPPIRAFQIQGEYRKTVRAWPATPIGEECYSQPGVAAATPAPAHPTSPQDHVLQQSHYS